MNFEAILSDITTRLLLADSTLYPPYLDTMTKDEKFKALIEELSRAIQLKNRKGALINAYFLGKFFNDLEESIQKSEYRRKVTAHYYRIAQSTFDLFEVAPEQIMHTQILTVQVIKRLHRNDLLDLRYRLLNYFVGTQILVDESCHGENGDESNPQ